MAITDINLSGKVRDDAGAAVADLTVYLLETAANLAGTQETTTTTDANGTWTFTEQTLTETYDIKVVSGSQIRYVPWSDEITLKTVDTSALKVRGVNGAAAPIYLFADRADANIDVWRINAAATTGLLTFDSRASGSSDSDLVAQMTITPHATVASSSVTIPGILDVNGSVDWDVTDVQVDSSGDIDLVSTNDAAAAIYLHENAGTSGTIKIHADQGTSVTESAESINILSDAGGVGIRSTANLANAVNITVDGGTTSSMTLFNDTGTSATEGSASIQLLSDVGGINLKSGLNGAGAVLLTADGGTSETIVIHADQGTGTGSIELLSDAGGIELDAGTDIILDAGGADIFLKDDGTLFGTLANSGGELVIKSSSSDTTAATFAGANVTFAGTVTTGTDGSGTDVIFYSGTSGDNLTWDASEEVLQITGTNGATALDVLDGDVRVVDKLYLYDRGGEYLSSDGSTLTITGATTVSGGLTSTAASNSFGATSFGDADITNVGDIALDSISADGTDINIAVDDNSATALTIKQGSDAYLIVDTANSSESVSIGTGVSGTAITLGHSTSEVTVADNLTVSGNLTVTGTQTIVDTVTMNAANAIVFEGATADGYETTLTIIDPTADRTVYTPNQDGYLPVLAAASTTQISATPEELNVLDAVTAGTVSASLGVVVDSNKDIGSFRNITLTGELDAGSLDVSGDADIDGTTNLDAVDIDGVVQIDNTVTVGVDDTGYDVKFFGAAAGSFLLYDTSADALVFNTTSVSFGGNHHALQVHGTGDDDSSISAVRWSTTTPVATGGSLNLGLGYHGTIGTLGGSGGAVQADDKLGRINFYGTNGTNDYIAGVDGIVCYAGSNWSGSNRETYMKFFTAANGATSSTARMTLDSSGGVFIGDSAHEYVDQGLVINQGSATNALLDLKQSGIDHKLDNVLAYEETDTALSIWSGASGGVNLNAFHEDSAGRPLTITAVGGTASTDKDIHNVGLISLRVYEIDGSGAVQTTVTSDGNVFSVAACTSGTNMLTRFIIDEDGDLFASQDGTTGVTVIDEYDDVSLVRALDIAKHDSGFKGYIESEWDEFIQYNEDTLVDVGILGAPIAKGGLINVTGLQRLHNGAIWQIAQRQYELESKLELAERKLAALGA